MAWYQTVMKVNKREIGRYVPRLLMKVNKCEMTYDTVPVPDCYADKYV